MRGSTSVGTTKSTGLRGWEEGDETNALARLSAAAIIIEHSSRHHVGMGLEGGLLLLAKRDVGTLVFGRCDKFLKLGIGRWSCRLCILIVIFFDDVLEDAISEHLVFLGISMLAHVAKRKHGAHGTTTASTGNLVEQVDVVLHRRGGGMRNDAAETAGLEMPGQETGLHLGGDADGGLEGSSSVIFGFVDKLFDFFKVELIAHFRGDGVAVSAALVVVDVDFKLFVFFVAGVEIMVDRGERIAKVGSRGGAQAGIASRLGATATTGRPAISMRVGYIEDDIGVIENGWIGRRTSGVVRGSSGVW